MMRKKQTVYFVCTEYILDRSTYISMSCEALPVPCRKCWGINQGWGGGEVHLGRCACLKKGTLADETTGDNREWCREWHCSWDELAHGTVHFESDGTCWMFRNRFRASFLGWSTILNISLLSPVNIVIVAAARDIIRQRALPCCCVVWSRSGCRVVIIYLFFTMYVWCCLVVGQNRCGRLHNSSGPLGLVLETSRRTTTASCV